MKSATLVILGSLLVGGSAIAQTSADQATRRGCVSSGPEQCLYIGTGKRRVQLVPQSGVAAPAASAFVIAKGKLRAVTGGACNVKEAFDAAAITVTKRVCKPPRPSKKK